MDRVLTLFEDKPIFSEKQLMLGKQNRALQALRRAYAWILVNQARLETIPGFMALVTRLVAVIEVLTDAGTTQERLRVAGLERTATASRVRKELRSKCMLPIVVVAQEAAPNDPDLAAEVRMPTARRNDERLLTSAQAIAKAVEAKQQLFIDNGLPPNFYEQLIATTNAFRQVIDERGSTRSVRKTSTGAVRSAIKEGRSVIRLLTNTLTISLSDTDVLAGWRSAMRIGQINRSALTASETAPVVEATPGTAITALPVNVMTPTTDANTVPAAGAPALKEAA